MLKYIFILHSINCERRKANFCENDSQCLTEYYCDLDSLCDWVDHCLGDFCRTFDDCYSDLVCTNGRCSEKKISCKYIY